MVYRPTGTSGESNFYAATPGDLDRVEIRCTVSDIDLAILLLGAWVCEGEQPAPEWFAIKRTERTITLTAGASSHFVTVSLERWQLIDERRALVVATIGLANAFACRSSEVPPALTWTLHTGGEPDGQE